MSLQATHSPSKFSRYFHFGYDFFKVSLFSPLSFPLYTRYKNPFSQGLSVTGSISNFTHSPFFCKHFFFFLHQLHVFSLLPSSFIIIYLLTPDEDNLLSQGKRLCFIAPCVSSYR